MGLVERVQIEGSPRAYLAPRGFRDRLFAPPDERMRILGPLDSLIWDRDQRGLHDKAAQTVLVRL